MSPIPEHAEQPTDVLMVEILFDNGGFVRIPYGTRSDEDDWFHYKTGIWEGDSNGHSYIESMAQDDRYSGLLYAFDVSISRVSAYFVPA